MKKNGFFDEQKTFERFTKVSENLNRKKFREMFDGDNLRAKVPL